MNKAITFKGSKLWLIPTVLSVLLLLFVIAPIIGMFTHMDAQSIEAVFSDDSVLTVIGHSLVASILTTVISIVLAYILAWSMNRTNMPFKSFFRLLIVLPMLIPSVSIGMGCIQLLGNNGIITRMLGLQSINIYGLQGIVIGSVCYSLPVAFLMIENILKYEDSSPYEAARVLGIPKRNQLTAITLPYFRKPMIAIAFSIFTLSFTDYGVPLMVGGKYKTLPVVMYQEVIGQLDFGRGCIYGSMLLVPAVIAFILDLMNKSNSNSAYVIKPFEITRNKKRDIAAMLMTVIVAMLSISPIFSFIVLVFVKKYPFDMTMTFANIEKTLQMGAGAYLLNSVIIALCVSVVGVIIGVLLAYYTARTKLRMARVLHLIAMMTAAVPGVVLGLAYILFFKNSIIYGTLLILVAANTVHFFASPYLMIYTSFSKINENLESVAATLGIGKLRLLKDVFLPGCKSTIAEMFSYFFVNSMMTISAVSFLVNTKTKVVSLMINQFEAQSQLEAAAVVSLFILIINLIVKIIAERKVS